MPLLYSFIVPVQRNLIVKHRMRNSTGASPAARTWMIKLLYHDIQICATLYSPHILIQTLTTHREVSFLRPR